MDLPHDLHAALESVAEEFPLRDLAASVERLITRYRRPVPAGGRPILVSAVDAAAYAAYRMPATWGAVRSVLEQLARRLPDYAPASQTDVGGGTGAAAWAAADTFGTLRDVEVLDQVPEALDLGRRLAAGATVPAMAGARWTRRRFGGADDGIPAADLVTVSYVLSELSPEEQADLVRRAAEAALARAAAVPTDTALDTAPTPRAAVAVIEPGTPDGYQRILAARSTLLAAGLTIVAPCPHQAPCPLVAPDWCHFASRVTRSPLHRRLKDADLGHEDEKFAYVVAVTGRSVPESPARILRHPQKRSGMVIFQLCEPDQTTDPLIVSKRQGPLYRAARDAGWGDPWPPPATEA